MNLIKRGSEVVSDIMKRSPHSLIMDTLIKPCLDSIMYNEHHHLHCLFTYYMHENIKCHFPQYIHTDITTYLSHQMLNKCCTSQSVYQCSVKMNLNRK